MSFVSIKRPAIFNNTENAFSVTYTAINPDTGKIESRTQIIEDTVERAITNNVTNEVTNIIRNLIIKIKNISEQIGGSLTFDVQDTYIQSSLAVYYNGLMISGSVTNKSGSTFTLSNDYLGILEEGDELFVSYSVENE